MEIEIKEDMRAMENEPGIWKSLINSKKRISKQETITNKYKNTTVGKCYLFRWFTLNFRGLSLASSFFGLYMDH